RAVPVGHGCAPSNCLTASFPALLRCLTVPHRDFARARYERFFFAFYSFSYLPYLSLCPCQGSPLAWPGDSEEFTSHLSGRDGVRDLRNCGANQAALREPKLCRWAFLLESASTHTCLIALTCAQMRPFR